MSIAALCCRCRLSLEQSPFLFLQRRFHRAPASDKRATRRSKATSEPLHAFGPTSQDKISDFFVRNVKAWSLNPRCHSRLHKFGIPTVYLRPLLKTFVDAVTDGQLHRSDEDWEKYGLARFGQGLRELMLEEAQKETDIIYSTIFFTWASQYEQQQSLVNVLRHQAAASFSKSVDVMSHIRRLSETASRRYPANEYPRARQMRRRIIMHVGPTNSGKTHHALRALAAAPSGVYAGPLRLLAHEIWERLNLGEITPLGMDDLPSRANAESHTSGEPPDYFQNHLSLLRAFNMSKRGNLTNIRPCNLVTGEEQKIVCDSAPLLSCTVEMLSMAKQYEVAVVDEIQMISDMQRGAGWTSAVLGLCAREIHLCGEETAVPIVQALLHETGDEVEVRRYERLTPLDVEGRSLEGDYGNVKKGDCVVAFSRSGIFGIKSKIEEKKGMKCAVVYGKLPPEVRSEQARLFNDPNSGYDVIIGSDAIGMGLNLKIQRVIFDAIAKWSEGGLKPLSASQIKQIAGRAGRYGLLRSPSKNTTSAASSHGGHVTTLHQTDLPFLKHSLATPVRPLHHARLGIQPETFAGLVHVLPAGASTLTVYEAHVYAGHIGDNYRYAMPDYDELKGICHFVDEKDEPPKENPNLGGISQHLDISSTPQSLTIEDRMTLCLAPVTWRDPLCVLAVKKLVRMYRKSLKVDLKAAIEGLGFMEALEGIESYEAASQEKPRTVAIKKRWRRGFNVREIGKINQTTLTVLETFHKVITVYLWLSFRNPASWGNHQEVDTLKFRVERALDQCLERLPRKVINEGILKEPPVEDSGEMSDLRLAVAC